MFAEDISRVKDTIDVMHLNEPSRNCLANMMEGQGIVMLVQLCVRNSGAVHDSLIVAKHVALIPNGDAKVT